MALGRDRDQALAIGRYSAVLDAVVGLPGIELVAFQIPKTELSSAVEGASDKVCGVWGPGGSGDGLRVVVDREDTVP